MSEDDSYLELFCVSDVAKIFEAHPQTVRNWIKRNFIKAEIIAGDFVIRKQDLLNPEPWTAGSPNKLTFFLGQQRLKKLSSEGLKKLLGRGNE